MLPIVHQTSTAAKVSIFNEAVHAKFPLLGLKFKNTAGQPLMQGPITVYEGWPTPATPASRTCSPARSGC